jgi:hypothetical protein
VSAGAIYDTRLETAGASMERQPDGEPRAVARPALVGPGNGDAFDPPGVYRGSYSRVWGR